MTEKIKISAVSYLNTLPFIYGLENSDIKHKIELSRDYPALCAEKLIANKVDIGLIPVAEILKIKQPIIVSDFCIGAVGKVNTVVMLSECPLEEIETVLLDYQSKTSVNLIKILYKHYWKRNISFKQTLPGYESQIKGNTAGLVIGDRVFPLTDVHKHVCDLSEEWLKFTGLPFVFAAWVSIKELPLSFIDEFTQALNFGLDNIDQVVEIYKSENPVSRVNIKKYLKSDISYILDENKRKGMDLFLKMLKNI